jgi:hypothetical protein
MMSKICLATCVGDGKDRAMRMDLDCLSETQKEEIYSAISVLREEFDRGSSTASQPWDNEGSILKIILFGGVAQNDWVDSLRSSYRLPFNLLVVVS